MIAAGGKMHCLSCLAQKLEACGVKRRNVIENLAERLRIDPEARLSERRETLDLYFSRGGDAGADLAASFRGRRQHEIGRVDGGHLDVQIDAVEQRPRKPRLIVGDATRVLPALAAESGIIGTP